MSKKSLDLDAALKKSFDSKTALKKTWEFVWEEKVAILFAIICFVGFQQSGIKFEFLVEELFTRIGRNTFIVLALIIPVVAGLGLNFGIVIGAMSAQLSLFLVLYFGVSGASGFFIAAAVSLPISIFLGWLVARLFNKMKGREMIGGMVLGFFADGIYQFVFLFLIGGFINNFGLTNLNPGLFVDGGNSIKNTLDLKDSLKYSLDNIPLISVVDVLFFGTIALVVLRVIYAAVKKEKLNIVNTIVLPLGIVGAIYGASYIPAVTAFMSTDKMLLLHVIMILIVAKILMELGKFIAAKLRKEEDASPVKLITSLIISAVIYGLTYIGPVETAVLKVKIPVMTFVAIGLLCVFNAWLLKTRLGQNMRTVGQNRSVANAAGINVDRVRIIAMILSTVLAGWGQLISLQSIGTVSTYGAHTQVGQFAIASLLVGGASVHKASNKHAILGVILFHTLFIIAPPAGAALFGSAQVGEYFRVFVAYGVIAVSLAMHAWKKKSGSSVSTLQAQLLDRKAKEAASAS